MTGDEREDAEAWATLTLELRQALLHSIEQEGDCVAAVLALASCAGEIISLYSTDPNDLETRLKDYHEMVAGMARERLLTRRDPEGAA